MAAEKSGGRGTRGIGGQLRGAERREIGRRGQPYHQEHGSNRDLYGSLQDQQRTRMAE